MSEMVVDHVKRVARLLSPAERTQLATWLLDTTDAPERVSADTRSLYGLLAESGPSPDAATIDDAPA